MDDELRRLRRVKWGAIGLAALFLAIVEAYYYFLRGVPLKVGLTPHRQAV